MTLSLREFGIALVVGAVVAVVAAWGVAEGVAVLVDRGVITSHTVVERAGYAVTLPHEATAPWAGWLVGSLSAWRRVR